ncbi:MAG: hypothetical protein GY798_12465 [Hyphomicrobiales bacterium]|nr:hypothetical protein [Hyphomicrobiales bacterium]
MSWVFLAGSRVYKLKKPVRYPFLDFSTLEAREHFVSEEGRLNRRLAPDVYLGATPLSVDEDGRMILGEADQVVDWLVTMRRLPEDRMLDRLITANALTADTVERLSDRLGAFFAAASAEYPDPAAFVDRYRREQAITSDVLLDPELGFDGARIGPLLERFTESFDQVRPHLEARLSAGRIVEGHGDLRPEHVFLSRSIAIIDCLEFNRDLRLLDPFEELAFLGLECARLGADWVFPLLYRRCAESLDDRPPTDVIAFYWRYRALLRARLSLAHLFEAKPRTPEKWRPLAWRYVVLAERDTVEIIRLDG